MEAIANIILSIQSLIVVVLAVIIIVLIVRRNRIKKTENFENRDN